MKKTSLTRSIVRGAAYAGIAFSVYTLSAGTASAYIWSDWGVSKGAMEYSDCANYQNTCRGWSWGLDLLLEAKAEQGTYTWSKAMDGSYAELGAVWDHIGGDTTGTQLEQNLTFHKCRCTASSY